MTRRQRLLELLQAAGSVGVTTADILEAGVGSRYGARLKELRSEGHIVDARTERAGSWRYRLHAAENPISPDGVKEGGAAVHPVASLSLFDMPAEAAGPQSHWEAA